MTATRGDAVIQTGLFEDRCGRCHGRGHPFVAKHLRFRDQMLLLEDGVTPLRRFLDGHFGRLTEAEADLLTENLTRIATRAGRFRERCAICHDTAEALARESVILVDGQPRGRYSGRDIGAFLVGHARLDAAAAGFFESVLRRAAKRVATARADGGKP